ALGTYLEGVRTIPVVWDQDELDWEAYQICMDWCRQEGIHTIADLTYRVVGTVDYQEKWLDRCCKMQADLAKKR
ncbi:MAG: hypothetical protein ACK2TV_15900, partial [Anaerolineales bacterium]